MMANNFPPGVSGTEPEIAGYDERSVEKNDVGYWLTKNGETTAFMEDRSRSLFFQCKPMQFSISKEDQHLSINKQDLAAFLRALGWSVETPEGD